MPDNISYLSVEERLKYLQDETIITMLPAIIFLIILGLTGLIGNSLVLIVYSKKYKWTSIKVFIMVIAVFDIIANILAIPGEIYNMLHTWDFDKPNFCKVRLFVNAYITIGSGLILMAIAVTRYRKICAPFSWQIDVKEAKIICLVVVILTGLISSPFFVIFGRLTKNNAHLNITGVECTTDDRYVNTVWPTVVYGLFLAMFIGCCISLFVLYIRIGIKAWKHRQMFGDSQMSMPSISDSSKRRIRKRPLIKTTTMLLVISAIYAFSYLPYLALMIFFFLGPKQYEDMTRAGAATYHVFLRFYFLNCAANAIIYSLCDVKFRRECVSLFRCSSCNK